MIVDYSYDIIQTRALSTETNYIPNREMHDIPYQQKQKYTHS